MKKIVMLLLSFMQIFCTIPVSAFAADVIRVTLDGQEIVFPAAQPFVNKDNRTLVPLSPIAKAMGLSVDWDNTAEMATFTRTYSVHESPATSKADSENPDGYYLGKETIAFRIGQKDAVHTIYYYGMKDTERETPLLQPTKTNTITMDTQAVIQSQRTYAPVKYLAEQLGYGVVWAGETNTVSLNNKGKTTITKTPDQSAYNPENPLASELSKEAERSLQEEKQKRIQEEKSREDKTRNIQDTSDYEQRVVELVNKERAAAGASALTFNKALAQIAEKKAEDMRDEDYFSHTSPTYGSPFDMMKQFGITYTDAAENIAKGQRTPEHVMEGWMNSPGHKKNILNGALTEIGVGYTVDESGRAYWVQMFIRP